MSQVVALDIDLPVKQAFHILHEQASSFSPFLPSVWWVENLYND